MKPIVTSLLVLLAFVSVVNAQEFEVATLKLSASEQSGVRINMSSGGVRNGIVTVEHATLAECIQLAYSFVSDAQIVGPDWIKSRDVGFDIDEKATPDSSKQTLSVMTQKLLADRLKFVAHHETRQLPFLALLVANGGPKISHDGAPAVPIEKLALAPDGIGATVQVDGRIASVIPMEVLATLLSRFERQTVMDMTGLEGPFRVVLQWTPDSMRGRTAPALFNADADNLDRPSASLDRALQEQLGLRLESRKGPVDVLVVDHAEKVPADN
jgi:uncharacterized protein (TIGR03435 family)